MASHVGPAKAFRAERRGARAALRLIAAAQLFFRGWPTSIKSAAGRAATRAYRSEVDLVAVVLRVVAGHRRAGRPKNRNWKAPACTPRNHRVRSPTVPGIARPSRD